MPLITYTFDQFVTQWVNAWAAQLKITPNLQPGDPALAIAQCTASLATSLQLIATTATDLSRATTCTGADLDNWMSQFSFPRLTSITPTGTVNFSSGTPSLSTVYVQPGTIVQTSGGAIEYQVVADPSQPSWNASLGVYVLAVGHTSIAVTCAALQPGTSFNVQAGQLNQLQTSIFGITTVSNPTALLSGADAETDVAFRARFVSYLNSLSKGTQNAIQQAVSALQAGLKVNALENVQLIGNPPTGLNSPYYGNVVVLVDDGSGNPPASLIASALAQVQQTVAYGIQYQVEPPSPVTLTIGTVIRLGPNGILSQVQSNINTAIINYVSNLNIGDVVWLDALIATIVNADPNIIAVQDNTTTINGVNSSLTLSVWQEALVNAGGITVSTF